LINPVERAKTSGIHGDIQMTIASPGIVMTETRYRPNSQLGTHAHQKGCFGVILEGDYLEGVRRDEFVCAPRTILYRPPMIEHWSTKGRVGARVLFLEVSDDRMDHIREYVSLPAQPTVYQSRQVQLLAGSIIRHWSAGDRATPLAIEGLLYEIAVSICQQRLKEEERRPQWLNRLVELLHERFNEPFRLSAVASEIGYHPVYVMRVFRRHYGMSVADYVRKLRVEYARKHLACEGMSLVDVGLSAGFPSQAYFSTIFKRETGITPGQYRRTAMKNAFQHTSSF
jgi:AraC-like DNA-binding protein